MSLETNKIFAAICVALIAAWFTAFIAEQAFHQDHIEKDAVTIEGAIIAGGSAIAKPQFPDPVLHLIATADITRGQQLSKACAACHSFNQGGINKVGPNLWNIVNKGRAQTAGFSYSDAIRSKEGNWTYQSLNHFLWKPKKYIQGTSMNYLGIKKPEDRAALIAWLRTLSPNPAADPSTAQIEQEIADFSPPTKELESDTDTSID